MSFTDRTYATAKTSTLGNVDFSQVFETDINSIRKSLDETQFVLKWITTHTPTFITDGSVTTTWTGTHGDCLILMATSEWSEPDPI